VLSQNLLNCLANYLLGHGNCSKSRPISSPSVSRSTLCVERFFRRSAAMTFDPGDARIAAERRFSRSTRSVE
jgi:hypothetical protein